MRLSTIAPAILCPLLAAACGARATRSQPCEPDECQARCAAEGLGLGSCMPDLGCACSEEGLPDGRGGGGGPTDPIVVGTITSLTGDLASLGPSWRDAVSLAVAEANAAGGIGGRRLSLSVEDDATRPEGAAAAAEALLERGAVGIVGPPTSASALSAVEVTETARVPLVSGTASSPSLDAREGAAGDAHPFFFRTVPADDVSAVVLAGVAAGEHAWGARSPRCARVALAVGSEDLTAEVAEAFAARFEALGGTIVAGVEVGYYPGEADLDELIAATPDCVAVFTFPEAFAEAAALWVSAGGDPDVFWLATPISLGLEDDLPPEVLPRTVAVDVRQDPTRPERLAFYAGFTTAFGWAPEVFSDSIYDAAAMLVLALARAGSTHGAAVRAALHEVSSFDPGDEVYGPNELAAAIVAIEEGRPVSYSGASGDVTFLPNGDVASDYAILMHDGSSFEPVAFVDAEAVRADLAE